MRFPVLHYLPESESEVAQLCPTLCNPIDCSLPDSLFHEIFQARILGWVAISFSLGLVWFDTVQGTLKCLFQHHSSKASTLQCSAFFIVQLSHPYMIIRNSIALTIRTTVSKVMSLLFNTLSRFVIAFLPRSKHLLISWLQSSSTLILEPKNMKSDTVSTFSSSVYHEVIRPGAMIFTF